MKFSIKDLFSKRDQIRSYLRIWSRLLKKSLMENFILCAVSVMLLSLRGKSVFHISDAMPFCILNVSCTGVCQFDCDA